MKTKLLIVDDSALLRNILKEVLTSTDLIEVVGEAANGEEGIFLNNQLNPDVIIMDINMPVMNGLEATQRIMASPNPVPIFILSNEIDSFISFKALGYGAVDVLKKPELDRFSDKEFLSRFVKRLRMVAAVKPKVKQESIETSFKIEKELNNRIKMIVMGASTGGPLALQTVLKGLPKGFNIPIIIVQHLESGFAENFVNWLDKESPLNVRLAKNKDVPQPGDVLVAPTDYHLIFYKEHLILDDSPKILNQKPSVDKCFVSAAYEYKSSLLGVLLTGMGRDGAVGCVHVRKNGGYTIVQNQESSVIYGMPKAAVESGGASIVLPVTHIAGHLLKLVEDHGKY